jgi:hypothetical protein
MREGGIKEEESGGEREGERCYIYILKVRRGNRTGWLGQFNREPL